MYMLPQPVAFAVSEFGGGTGPILLGNVGCSGTETDLLNCSHNGDSFQNCMHSENAGVICNVGMITIGLAHLSTAG